MLAEKFKIFHQMPGRVLSGFTKRLRLTRTALVKNHGAVASGIKKLSVRRFAPPAGTAMQKDDRQAVFSA